MSPTTASAGVPLDGGRAEGANAEAGFDKGAALGKRHTEEGGALELLCTKAGRSSLSVGDVLLEINDAKSLPSPD